MAQYYQIIQNVDGLNLENCVIMNEDGTPLSPRSVMIPFDISYKMLLSLLYFALFM